MAANLDIALELAQCVKRVHPKSVTVFGGVAASPLHEQVAAHTAVDVVIRGRGEVALPAVLSALDNGQPLEDIGNVSTRVSGRVRTVPWVYAPVSPMNLAFPAVNLFDADLGADIRYLRIVHGLGCPYRCPFCSIQTIGQRTEYFPVDRVLSEIKAYRERFGAHHNVYFGDETFGVNRRTCLELCAALDDGGVSYDCQTRLNCIKDPALVEALASSGCRWLEIGLEVLNQHGQNDFKQGTPLGPVEDTLARVRDAGIAACSFLINGLPGQSIDDMRRSIDAACKLIERGLLHASYLFGFVPYPGSTLYQEPEQHGLTLLHRNLRLYLEDGLPVYRMPHAGEDEIYSTFLYGVNSLAEAMGGRPWLGDWPVTANVEYRWILLRGAHLDRESTALRMQHSRSIPPATRRLFSAS